VGEPTYAAKLSPDDLRLDWTAPASQRHRVVRLGGAWTTFRDKRLKVIEAELVDPDATGGALLDGRVGGLRLLVVQPEGKAPMPWRDFANGTRPTNDEVLV
jgi:methionyl-tRNA formyltransferase